MDRDERPLQHSQATTVVHAATALPPRTSRALGAVVVRDPVRWHYHYMGNTVVAATREVVKATGPEVKRFWFVQDERGLVHRLLDEQGATYWQARWDASGWRTLVGTPQPNMWVPFGLPGQLILESSQAFAKDSPTSSTGQTRPAIALNQYRSYDPLTAAFTQPEALDVLGQIVPSGYSYARHSSVMYTDSDGFNVMPVPDLYAFRKHKGCGFVERLLMANAIIRGSRDFEACVDGLCDWFGGENLKRWVNFWLGRSEIVCVDSDSTDAWAPVTTDSGEFVRDGGHAWDMSQVDVMQLPPIVFRGRPRALVKGEERTPIATGGSFQPVCLKEIVVHEALHMAWRQIGPNNSSYPPLPYIGVPRADIQQSYAWVHHTFDAMYSTIGITNRSHESYVYELAEGCVKCRP